MTASEHPGIDVSVKRTGPCLARVTFTVTAEAFRRDRERGLRDIARRTHVKGFRPGKTPAAMIEKRFGAEVDKRTIEGFLNRAYEIGVQSEKLRPAAYPRVDLDEIKPAQEGGLEHEFEVLLRPEVKLGTYKGLELERRPTDPSDEEVEEAMADLRRQSSRPEPAGEDGLPADGMAVCRLELLPAGADEPALARDGIRLGPKTPPPGVDAGAFEQAMLGARQGEEREIPIHFPDDFPVEAARGQDGVCRVALTEAYRIVAPTDKELFEPLGVASLEELRSEIAKRIRTAKEEHEEGRLEGEALRAVVESHQLDLPEPLVEEHVASRLKELRGTLEGQGLEPDEVERRVEADRPKLDEAARKSLAALYLIEEIASAEDIRIAESDILEEMRSIAARNRADLEEVKKYYQSEGLVSQLAMELLERKVRRLLRESARIA